MKSPVESEIHLVKSELDTGLTSWRCPSSGGHWLPAPSYWRWHAQQSTELKNASISEKKLSKLTPTDIDTQLERPALLCPETHCLLVRYKVAGLGIFIDRSPVSGGIWLDAGEWKLLKENNVHASLHEIFTTSYQKRIVREEAREALMHKFYTDIGEEVAEDLTHLAEWLKLHPKRRRIIAWLHEQLALDEDDFQFDDSATVNELMDPNAPAPETQTKKEDEQDNLA